MRLKHRRLILPILIVAIVAACQSAPAATTQAPTEIPAPSATPRPTNTSEPTNVPAAADTAEPPATPNPVAGPDSYPEGVNPLTGLAVDDPAVLAHAPLLIIVSNESAEVRPQSGLMYADHVWEYQMEGFRQTRFTAVVYGQSPERVGSVRSVRLINTEHLRPMYDGLLVISGASTGVYQILQFDGWWDRVFREEPDRPHLVRIRDIPRENTDFYHALFAVPEEVWKYADERGVNTPPQLAGLAFGADLPEGGQSTTDLIMDYPKEGPIRRWHYDEGSGRWLSFTTDQKTLEDAEAQDFDLLADAPLAFDNVIVLYVEHYLSTIIEDQAGNLSSVGVKLVGEGDAVLLRDGQRFEAKWQRDEEGMLRLVDEGGQPLPLKPGNTWFMPVSSNMFTPEVRFEP